MKYFDVCGYFTYLCYPEFYKKKKQQQLYFGVISQDITSVLHTCIITLISNILLFFILLW